MHRLQASDIAAAAVAFLMAIGFTLAGGTLALGAHPFWAARVGYIGAAIGLVAWLGLTIAGLRPRVVLILAAVALVAFGLSVYLGKQRFVASYADDALAGRFWSIGWFGLMAAALALVASLLSLLAWARR